MTTMQLWPRPLYGIGTVARLTGVKPDTLRVWERRYRLGASHKTASGRRQYTQGDLEHLQLVAALVGAGTRIGEIASSERRTLEVMLREQSRGDAPTLPEPKPRIVFIGEDLCDWLEEHQGCLVNSNALLAPCAAEDFDARAIEDPGEVDGVVVECRGLNGRAGNVLAKIAAQFSTTSILALCRGSGERWQAELEKQGIVVAEFPPDPAFLAFHLSRCAAEKISSEGSGNLGKLLPLKPRMFSPAELSVARQQDHNRKFECPRHLADLIRSLSEFEEHAANRSVEDWHDASVHACVYAYASQSRWLLEKALSTVLDDLQAPAGEAA